MKISVFGVGYVGLVTATCFAELGNEVLACDIDERKIEGLRAGNVPIYEPGLEEIVKRTTAAGRLRFTTNAREATHFADIIFIAVGTPASADGTPNLQYVKSVVRTIGEQLTASRSVIVMKSTVPVGTNAEVRQLLDDQLQARGVTLEFAVVSNPEFLREGEAIRDFLQPDRIVVGAAEPWAREKMAELYAPFTEAGRPLLFMDQPSAEMSKYAANALLATKISFINQIATLCEVLGADIQDVRQALIADTRIGPHFLNPGIGYGGSCFPKDVQALALLARSKGHPLELIEAIETVNEQQKRRMVERAAIILGDLRGQRIALWGLAFKPQTDDIRQAPSLAVIEELLKLGAIVTAYDPAATGEAKKVFGDRIAYADDKYGCLREADALMILTEWPEFREPDFVEMSVRMKQPYIFDGRNIYDPVKLAALNFKYFKIGKR